MGSNCIDLTLGVEETRITPINNGITQVDVYQVSKTEVLAHFSIEDMLDYFDYDEILDGIGSDYCKDYFDLIDGENEED